MVSQTGLLTVYNQWLNKFTDIEKVYEEFYGLKNDEERVQFVMGCLNEETNALFSEIVGKKNSMSLSVRELGNAEYKKKQFYSALFFYNKCIAYAVPDTYDFAVGFGNRAACLIALKHYSLALSDVRQALRVSSLNNGYKQKLLNRELECLKVRQDKHDSIRYCPSLSSANAYFDSATEKVEIASNENIGRHLISNNSIRSGEIIMVETPYTFSLVPSAFHSHCTHCLTKSLILLPCDKCTVAMFCSEKCLEASKKQYHAVECNFLEYLVAMGFSKMDLLSLRILITSTQKRKSLHNLKEDILSNSSSCSKYNALDFLRIYSLIGNTVSRTVSDLFRRTFSACTALLALKRFSNFFDLSEDMFYFAGGLILRFMQSLPCNAHEITEFVSGECVEIGAGAYATHSLLNHSCDPNVVRKSYGPIIVLRAIRPIHKGEEIVDNYGYHYALLKHKERQSSLLWQYHFTCQCEPCKKQWPLYTDLPSTTPIFRKGRRIDNSVYNKITEKFEEKLKLVLNNTVTRDTVEFLCRYLDFLDYYVERPWQNYNKCQEAIKHALHFCEDFDREASFENENNLMLF